jgi:hypothetical protein
VVTCEERNRDGKETVYLLYFCDLWIFCLLNIAMQEPSPIVQVRDECGWDKNGVHDDAKSNDTRNPLGIKSPGLGKDGMWLLMEGVQNESQVSGLNNMGLLP